MDSAPSLLRSRMAQWNLHAYTVEACQGRGIFRTIQSFFRLASHEKTTEHGEESEALLNKTANPILVSWCMCGVWSPSMSESILPRCELAAWICKKNNKSRPFSRSKNHKTNHQKVKP